MSAVGKSATGVTAAQQPQSQPQQRPPLVFDDDSWAACGAHPPSAVGTYEDDLALLCKEQDEREEQARFRQRQHEAEAGCRAAAEAKKACEGLKFDDF